MTGIADTTVVDVIAKQPDGTMILIMVENRAWASDPLQAEQLKQKINRYTGYAIEGGLVRDYPDMDGKPVIIQLNCLTEPTGEFGTITQVTASGLERLGIAFVVNARDNG